jgi:hypothetical protein
MIFNCYDLKTHDLVFKYSSLEDNHDCISERNIHADEGCRCGENRYYIAKRHEKSGRIFAICFDGIRVRKEAVFYAKHTIDMFLMANPIIDSRHDDYEKMVKASIHNTKNLNSQITSKIESLLKQDLLSVSKDKVGYIENIIKNNTYKFAREILSILKISTQISSDYNVIDYLKPNISLRKSEFGYTKLHSILVKSFYQFESDFNAKNVYVEISTNDLSVYINYNTVQTLLTHLFTNALKYCIPESSINISASFSGQFVKVTFKMKSLYLTDDILKNGRLNGERTEQARKMYEKGTGLGLGIIDTLAKLNKGNFDYFRISEIEYSRDGFKYSLNSFEINLLKDEFY